MTTVHANNPRDALSRIENMVSMAGLNFPVKAIRQQVASALDLLIHLGRLTGGHRKVVAISEVTSMEGEVILLQDIFRFRQTGVDPKGSVVGQFESCGTRPQILDRLQAEGIELPSNIFERRVMGATASHG